MSVKACLRQAAIDGRRQPRKSSPCCPSPCAVEEPNSSNDELPYYDHDHNSEADGVNDSPSLEELIVHVHRWALSTPEQASLFYPGLSKRQFQVSTHEMPASRNSGNVRMRKPAKDGAFAFESFFSRAPGERHAHELHRSLPLEPTVTATGKPDAPHSALAKLRDRGIRTKCLARESRGVRQRLRLTRRAGLTIPYEQRKENSEPLDAICR